MSQKFYFLKVLVTTFIAPFLAAVILVLPASFVLGWEKMQGEALSLAVVLGYMSSIPFFLLLYCPAIYLLSKTFFTPVTFVSVSFFISLLVGYVVATSLKSPGDSQSVSIKFLAVYACTGVLAGGIQYVLLSVWGRKQRVVNE